MKMTDQQKAKRKAIKRAADIEAWKKFQAGMAESHALRVRNSNAILASK